MGSFDRMWVGCRAVLIEHRALFHEIWGSFDRVVGSFDKITFVDFASGEIGS